MKSSKLNRFLLTVFLFLSCLQGFSQLVGTRIDVQSAHFSDKMWIFTEPSCTRFYDNGWDGYKMLGTSQAPQLYAVEPDGNYQIDVIPDINNTNISFTSGIDTTYTLTFTHQYLSNRYDKLYLIDSLTNKTIDIYENSAQYTFSATNRAPLTRFKIVTNLESANQPITNVATSTTEITDHTKKLKIYSFQKNICLENTGDQTGTITIYSAVTGKVFKIVPINSNKITIISTNTPTGAYVVRTVTQTDEFTTKILIL